MTHCGLQRIEPPLNAELTLDTVMASPESNAYHIVEYLAKLGFILSMPSRRLDAPESLTISDKVEMQQIAG